MEITSARSSLCADDEYVFGASVVNTLEQEGDDSTLARELIAQAQQTAEDWLASEDPGIAERHKDVRRSFYWSGMEVPSHIDPNYDIQQDVVRWLATAQPDAVRAFMKWNVAEQNVMQTDLADRLPTLQEHTICAISKLVCEGSIPHAALNAYRQAIDETREVYALDAIAVGEKRCDGIYYLGSKVMGLNGALLYLPDDDPYQSLDLDASVLHEYGHAVEAVGYNALRGVGTTSRPEWLIEAFNEHMTQVGLFGSFNTVSPIVRDRLGTYQGGRLLMSALLDVGSIPIHPRALALEAFRPFDPSDGHSHVRTLIDESFVRIHDGPESLVDRICQQYNDAATKVDEYRIMEYWYDTITQQVGYDGPSAAALLYNNSPDSSADIRMSVGVS
jgi:hypothetical protein